MSTTIDKKVVEMHFDNKQFESGVKTSLQTIEKLKEKLKFADSAKGLDELGAAAKKVDFSSISEGVESTKVKFSAMQVVAATALSEITKSVMNTGKKIFNVLTGTIVQGGMKRAMNLENAHFMLQGLLKDETKVQAVMSDVNKSVDGTAYSLDQAAVVAAQFAATGIQAGDDMLTALRGVTGVAAITNSEFADMGRIFTTIAGNGRMMGDQLLQLGSRGLDAAQTIADFVNSVNDSSSEMSQKVTQDVRDMVQAFSNGAAMTGADIRALVSKGEISFDLFSAAMSYTFGDQAEKANETFSGSMSNVKSALARIGALFYTDLLQQNGPIVGFFNALRVSINMVKKAIEPFAAAFVEKIANVINIVTEMITSFTNAWNTGLRLKTYMQALSNVIDSVWNILTALVSILKAVAKAFSETFPNASRLSILAITKALKSFTEKLILSENASKALTSILKLVFSAFKLVFSVIKLGFTILKPFISLFGFLIGKLMSLAGIIASVLGHIADFITKGSTLTRIVQAITNLLNRFFRIVKRGIDAGLAGLAAFFGMLGQKIKAKALELLGPVIERIGNALKKIPEFFRAVGAAAANVGKKIVDAFMNSGILSFFQRVGEVVVSLAKGFGMILGGAVVGLVTLIGRGIQYIRDYLTENDRLKNAVGKVVDYIKEKWEQVRAVMSLVTETVKTAFNAFKSNVQTKAIEIFGPIIDEIKEKLAGFNISFEGVGEGAKNLGEKLKAVFQSPAFATALMTIGSKLGEVAKVIISVFGRAVTFVIEKAGSLWEHIKNLASVISDFYGKFKEKFQAKSLDAAKKSVDKVKDAAEKAGGVFENLKGKVKGTFSDMSASIASSGLKEALGVIWEAVKTIASGVAGVAGEAIKTVADGISQLDLSKIAELVKSGGLLALAIGIKDFLTNISSPASNLGSALGTIKDVGKSAIGIFDQLKETLSGYQKELKVARILAIATAIGILTGSVALLTFLDQGKLASSIVYISALFANLTLAMKSINESKGENSAKAISSVISIALAVSILAGAMKKLGNLSPDQAAMGLGSVMLMTSMMTRIIKSLATLKDADLGKAVAGIISFSVAVGILSVAVRILAKLNPTELLVGLGGVLALIIAIGLFISNVDFDNAGTKVTSILGLAIALNILALAVKAFGQMKPQELAIGIGAVAASLMLFAIVLTTLSDVGGGAVAGAAGILIITIALQMLVPVLFALGTMKWETLVQGLKGLAIALGIFVAAGLLLSVAATGLLALSLVLAAISVLVLAVGVGVSLLATGLLNLVTALALVTTVGAGAATALTAIMKTMVSGLIDLIPTLFAKIGEGITTMMTTVLKSFGQLATVAVPMVRKLLATIAQHLPEILKHVETILRGILNLIKRFSPMLIDLALTLLINLYRGIRDNLEEFIQVGSDIVVKLLQGLQEQLPRILEEAVNLVVSLIDGLATALENSGPKLAEAIRHLLDALLTTIIQVLAAFIPMTKDAWNAIMQGGFLEGIGEKIGDVLEKIGELIAKVLLLLASKMVEFLKKGKELVKNIIDGIKERANALKERVRANIDAAKQAIHDRFTEWLNTGKELITKIIGGVSEKAEAFKEKVTTTIANAKQAIIDKLSEWLELGKNFIQNVIDGVTKKAEDLKNWIKEKVHGTPLETVVDLLGKWLDFGKDIINNIVDGITKIASNVATAVKNAITGAKDEASTKTGDFYSVGSNITDGIARGIEDSNAISALKSKARLAVKAAKGAAEAEARISSPSKVFAEIGRFMTLGMAIGIGQETNAVEKASADAAKVAISKVRGTLAKLSDTVTENIDTNPTIKPVLDLSDVQSGIGQLDTMFSRNQALKVGGANPFGIFAGTGTQQGNTYVFNQNNYSPKALSRIDIYRQTMSQFSNFRRTVGA